MSGAHPTGQQLDRYRRRLASPVEMLVVDRHVATCDRCFELVRADADPAIALPVAHLTYEELEAYVDGRADAYERAMVAEHTAQCAACREEMGDLQKVREAGFARPTHGGGVRLRWGLVAAAAVLAIIVGIWFLRPAPVVVPQPEVRREVTPTPTPPAPRRVPEGVRAAALEKPAILDTLMPGKSVLRGGAAPAFRLVAPVATVVLDDRPRFQWEAAPNATSYDVAVADAQSGNVAVTGSSETTRWRAGEPLRRGRTYTWQVTAHTPGGTSLVAPGPAAPEALFHVAAKVEPLPEDPVERGVALANAGVLDEAESALRDAAKDGELHAEELLEEVRSWRTSSHGLPTTMNGAQ